MKNVIMYKSDNGKVYETKIEALEADLVFWKELGQKELDRQKADRLEMDRRMPYHERGGHQ